MQFEVFKELNVSLKYPKIFQYKNKIYLVGSKNFNVMYELDTNFNILTDEKILNFSNSSIIRDIKIVNDVILFNVEHKNDKCIKNYLYSTDNLTEFIIIKEYQISDYLFTINSNVYFTSKIDTGLFQFIKNNESFTPIFDKIVNYDTDKCHILHSIIDNKDEYEIFFSTLNSESICKTYIANSKDLINYYNIQEFDIKNPSLFGNDYLVCENDKNISILKKNKIISIIENEEFYYYRGKIDKSLTINNNIETSIDVFKNVLFKLGRNYDLVHILKRIAPNNYSPTSNILLNYIRSIQLSENELNSNVVENGVFFYSIAGWHDYFTHLIFDYMAHMNQYYYLLKQNPDYKIIMEIIPSYYTFSNIPQPNCKYVPIENINKIKLLFKNLGINNNIIFISPSSEVVPSLFVKNLYYVNYKDSNNVYLPLITRCLKNKQGKYLSDTIKEIIGINKHYIYHKCKFFILEDRAGSQFGREIDRNQFEIIKQICENYCIVNNLKLVIWNKDFTNNNDIYEQFTVVNNSEIMICFGGSILLFNNMISESKVLLLNIKSDIDIDVCYNMMLNGCKYLITNKDIKNLVLHFSNSSSKYNLIPLILNFLYKDKNFKHNFNKLF